MQEEYLYIPGEIEMTNQQDAQLAFSRIIAQAAVTASEKVAGSTIETPEFLDAPRIISEGASVVEAGDKITRAEFRSVMRATYHQSFIIQAMILIGSQKVEKVVSDDARQFLLGTLTQRGYASIPSTPPSNIGEYVQYIEKNLAIVEEVRDAFLAAAEEPEVEDWLTGLQEQFLYDFETSLFKEGPKERFISECKKLAGMQTSVMKALIEELKSQV